MKRYLALVQPIVPQLFPVQAWDTIYTGVKGGRTTTAYLINPKIYEDTAKTHTDKTDKTKKMSDVAVLSVPTQSVSENISTTLMKGER